MRYRRVRVFLGTLMVVGLLAACGRDGDAEQASSTSNVALTPAGTLRPPAPRALPVPQVAPHEFEAPFTVGVFVRQRMFGKPDATQTGGQRAIYRSDDGTVVLNVYYFPSAEEATRTVQFTLEAGSAELQIVEPYYAPDASFGAMQDANGDYVVAWSHDNWAYIVRTGDSARVLDQFLALFPY